MIGAPAARSILVLLTAIGCQRDIRFDSVPPDDSSAPAETDGGVPAPDAFRSDTGSGDGAASDRPAAEAGPDTSPGDRPHDVTAPDVAPADVAPADVAPADTPPRDAPPAADRAPPPDIMSAPTCPGLCSPWSPQCVTGTSCDSDCDNGARCNGSCGTGCSARCRGTSDCSVSAAENADLECREGSNCGFILASGNVRCRESADCNVRCLGPCTLACEGANCTLRCANDPAPRSANNGGSCN